MAIPTQFDIDMAGVADIAATVLQQLGTMQRAAPRDLARMRAQLRQTLQEFCDEVMATARTE